jgi:DNA modification methylase
LSWHPDMPEAYQNAIVTGDARELAARIPDESVDLVFTDPVYDRIEDYCWLGRLSRRVLRPGGAVLVWSNGRWHRDNAQWLEMAGLRYRWEFAYVITGGAAPMNGRIIAKTNRLLWLDRAGDSRMVDYLADGYAGVTWSRPGTHNHRWTKSPKFTAQALAAFSQPWDVVLDPFCGGGTVQHVCKLHGREFVGFEIDPETAEIARERVRLTPEPLLVLDAPEPQTALELAL